MRELKTADLFVLSRILKKMNIKGDIKALVQDITGLTEEEKAKAQQGLSLDLVMLFAENIGGAEKEIYNLFADLTGRTAKEIEGIKLNEFFSIIQELFKQEGFQSFLSVALK